MFGKAKQEVVKKPEGKASKKKEAERAPLLKVDQVIAGESGCRYVIEGTLGKGGFGEVYKVSPLTDPDKKFAMKVESNYADEKHKQMLRLKIETHVFDSIKKARDTVDTSHFVNMHDKGKTADFKYYVMDLIWLSLRECVKKICNGVLSAHSKVIIARQTLIGIEVLHQLGFLHRDIKGHNFAVGLPPNDNVIYCIDFGICRPFRDKQTGVVLVPRARVEFLGSPCYASIASLECREQSRRDDLESWLYMMLELYDESNLLWASTGKSAWVPLRKKLLEMPQTLITLGTLKVPIEWASVIGAINHMTYYQAGDFRALNRHLDALVAREKIDERLPLDWVGKRPKSPEKPKKVEPPKKPEVKKERKKESKKVDEGSTQELAFPPDVDKLRDGGSDKERKKARLPLTEDYRDDYDEDSDSDEFDAEEYEDFLKMRRKKRRRGSRKRDSRGYKRDRRRSSNERGENTDKKRRGKKRSKESHGNPEKAVDGEKEGKIEKEGQDQQKGIDDKPAEGRKKDSKAAGEIKVMDKQSDEKEKKNKEVKEKERDKEKANTPEAKSPVTPSDDTPKKAAEAATPVKKETADKKK